MTEDQYAHDTMPFGFGVFDDTKDDILRSRILKLHFGGHKPETIARMTDSTESHVRQVLGRRLQKNPRFIYAFDMHVGRNIKHQLPLQGPKRNNKVRAIRAALERWIGVHGGEYETELQLTHFKVTRIK